MQFDFLANWDYCMKNKPLLILLLSVLTFVSCKDDFHIWKEANEQWLADNKPIIDSLENAPIKDGYQRAGITPSGIQYIVYHNGFGATAKRNSQVILSYENYLIDGTKVGAIDGNALDLETMPDGWKEMICDRGLKQGAYFKMFCPWNLAFGKDGNKVSTASRFFIPPYSTLISTIRIIDVRNMKPE